MILYIMLVGYDPVHKFLLFFKYRTKVPERPKQLQSEPKQSSTKYEQMLLNPANFLKNSCEVYVAASKNTRPSASEEET